MSIDTLLNDFDHIGIDVDETLIGDNRISWDIQDYIIANAGKKAFSIITHRAGAWVDRLWDDVALWSGDRISSDMFVSVFSFDEALWNQVAPLLFQRRIAGARGGKILEPTGFEAEFYQWKGKICHQNNIQVLVDDRGEWNRDGCLHHGVHFIGTQQIEARNVDEITLERRQRVWNTLSEERTHSVCGVGNARYACGNVSSGYSNNDCQHT